MKTFLLSLFTEVTPVSLFAALRETYGAPTILLESAVQDEANRISLVAAVPVQSLEISDGICGGLRERLDACYGFDDNPYFSGGLMGSLMFESFFDFFPKYSSVHAEDLPRTLMYEFGIVCVFDHGKNELVVLQHPDVDFDAANFLGQVKNIPFGAKTGSDVYEPNGETDDVFLDGVAAAREAIYAGEVFQLVLSHVFEQPTEQNKDIALYQTLKHIEPTTHLILADYGEHGVYTCASPEIIGKKKGSRLLVTPIAGTRRKKTDPAENKRTQNELLADPKENAEHDMLVDLGRNDLGRVAQPGTVEVVKYKYLQEYAHVMHLLSDVEADIAAEYDTVDFLRSIFPAGTLSGAPKVRAVKLIQDNEPCARGFYGGATGILEKNGDMQMAINIRGVHMKDGMAKIQVGAGIVKESVPEYEWKELHNKSRTLQTIFLNL